MIICDKQSGLATDIGEFWTKDYENKKDVIVEIALGENKDVSFYFLGMTLKVPTERLKRIL